MKKILGLLALLLCVAPVYGQDFLASIIVPRTDIEDDFSVDSYTLDIAISMDDGCVCLTSDGPSNLLFYQFGTTREYQGDYAPSFGWGPYTFDCFGETSQIKFYDPYDMFLGRNFWKVNISAEKCVELGLIPGTSPSGGGDDGEDNGTGSIVNPGGDAVAEQLAILNERMRIQTETPAGYVIITQDGIINQISNIMLPSGLIAYNSGDVTLIDFAGGQELTYLPVLTGEVLEGVNDLGGTVTYAFLSIVAFVLLGYLFVRFFTSFYSKE